MDTALEYFCGIHINNERIQGAIFDANGNLQTEKYLDSPKPLMPGATTVLLCDLIQLIDPHYHSKLVGIAVPFFGGSDGPSPKTINTFPYWHDVPFQAWLEIRLHRKIVLLGEETCKNIKANSESSSFFTCSKGMPIVSAAALLALEHFKI